MEIMELANTAEKNLLVGLNSRFEQAEKRSIEIM